MTTLFEPPKQRYMYVLQGDSNKVETPRTHSNETLQIEENKTNFSDLRPTDHSPRLHRASRPSILRKTSRKTLDSIYNDGVEYNQRTLQWNDIGSPDKIENKETTTTNERRPRQNQTSRSRSLSGTRLHSSSDYLPYFRSKSVHNLDTESIMSQFRPATNHKAVIDHTYNIERSRTRAKSRDGFVRKRVVTTPLVMQESHRERTLYTDRFRGMKDVYTESNTEQVEKQFYKKLVDVKMEEFRSVSRLTDKNSKHRKKVLLKQIQDLRKMNTKYGRAVEKRYKSKFSVYHPTDTAARFKDTTGNSEKGKYAHDFSKWRQKEQDVRLDERSPGNNLTNNTRTNKKKGRSYKGPSWEKEGFSYMRRMEKHNQNEDYLSGEKANLRAMLKETENLLNVVEHNFPEVTNQRPGMTSPTKTISPTHKKHLKTRSQTITKKAKSKSRTQSVDDKHLSNARSKSIEEPNRARSRSRSSSCGEEMSPDHPKSGYPKADIKTIVQNINLRGSAREASSKRLGLTRSHYNTQIKLDSPECKYNTSPMFERSKSLNSSPYGSKEINELSKEAPKSGITRTSSDIYRGNRTLNLRLSKQPTHGSVERSKTISSIISVYKDFKAKQQSGLHDKKIIIPAPPIPGQLLKEGKETKIATKLPPVSTPHPIGETDNTTDEKVKMINDNDTCIVKGNNTDEKLPKPVVIKNEEREVSDLPPVTCLPKEQRAVSRLAIRIDAPTHGRANSRITPADKSSLSRQSFRKTPVSKPSSREKLKANKDRILITPISLKNKKQALLVANYRIITPVGNESGDLIKEETQYDNGDFFLTFVDPGGGQKASLQVQSVENTQASENSTTANGTIDENTLKAENTEDAICLDKWKALVHHYLSEADNET